MPADPPDWTLVAQIKGGDESAFDALMDRYKRPIHAFVFRMLADAAETQDIAQEVFVRAWRAIQAPSFRQTDAQFAAWLFRIARNAALDALRRRRRHPAVPLDVDTDLPETSPAAGPTPPAAIAAAETGAAIAAAVAALPEDQRAAFILSEYEELPDAQIATVLNCSTKSVETRLYRARHSLRNRLADLLD